MFSKGESRSPGGGDRSRRLGSGARMTGCRDLTRVGEMGTDGGWYGPCGPHRYRLCPCLPLAFSHHLTRATALER